MSVIVNVRGACGAGKSTLVKTVLDEETMKHGFMKKIESPGRRKPIGYVVGNLFVPGHYEIQNGGLDTIGDLERAHFWIREFFRKGFSVLFEGMNQKRDDRYLEGIRNDLAVVFVDIPIETCREGFAAKGQRRKQDYVKDTWGKARREQFRLRELGLRCFSEDTREKALERVRDILAHGRIGE